MLSLTKKTEYALIAFNYLFRNPDKVCSAREIADASHVSLPLLMNILKSLQQNEMIHSTRGAKGGYQLPPNAQDISLHQIILAVEGPVKMIQCVGDNSQLAEHENRCELLDCCAIRSPLLKIHEKLENLLSTITLVDLVNEEDPMLISCATKENKVHEAYLSR